MLFGMEISNAGQYLIAFAIIFGVVALVALAVRRATSGRSRVAGSSSPRARQPRLGIVDVFDLDRQRQLVLVRRDNVEHLVMIGGPTDVLIEGSIVRGAARAGAPLPGFEAALAPVIPGLEAQHPLRPTVVEPREDFDEDDFDEPRQPAAPVPPAAPVAPVQAPQVQAPQVQAPPVQVAPTQIPPAQATPPAAPVAPAFPPPPVQPSRPAATPPLHGQPPAAGRGAFPGPRPAAAARP